MQATLWTPKAKECTCIDCGCVFVADKGWTRKRCDGCRVAKAREYVQETYGHQCVRCRVEFRTREADRKYCGRACRDAAIARPECECRRCGVSFMPKTKDRTSYCSRECAQKRPHRRVRLPANAYRHTLTITKRIKVFERDGWACVACHSPVFLHRRSAGWIPNKAVVDHIHPVAAGGDSGVGNLQTMCAMCNAIKCDKVAGGGRWCMKGDSE